jgi:hypothetical protein
MQTKHGSSSISCAAIRHAHRCLVRHVAYPLAQCSSCGSMQSNHTDHVHTCHFGHQAAAACSPATLSAILTAHPLLMAPCMPPAAAAAVPPLRKTWQRTTHCSSTPSRCAQQLHAADYESMAFTQALRAAAHRQALPLPLLTMHTSRLSFLNCSQHKQYCHYCSLAIQRLDLCARTS